MTGPVDRLRLAETLAALLWVKKGLKCDAHEMAYHWTVPAMRKRINELSNLKEKS